VKSLAGDPSELDRLSEQSRNLAEARFDIGPIAAEFEHIAFLAAERQSSDAGEFAAKSVR
jgi:hypothetical protein